MQLFVYGTLRSDALMTAVAGEGTQERYQATLADFAVLPVAGDAVPLIRSSPGAVANGVVWSGLSDVQIARLDLYEGAFGYALVQVEVQLECGETTSAWMYLPPDDIPVGEGTWSLADWERDHQAPALFAAAEVFATQPLPTPEALRANWQMIERRAWSRHRASLDPARPDNLRYSPRSDDVAIYDMGPPVGSFFRMQQFVMDHRRFDGTRQPMLNREVALGVDAALVLPYDPDTDNVLLVEQARMGPLIRQDPNPWTLEPVAGMIDAREDPQTCARRELLEEAGITARDLIDIGAGYPSPGNLTDHFYCYLGLCDLPQTGNYTGGLDVESEDLRLHVLPFAQALLLAESGEITALPLVTMLYWLAIHRDGLRGPA